MQQRASEFLPAMRTIRDMHIGSLTNVAYTVIAKIVYLLVRLVFARFRVVVMKIIAMVSLPWFR